MPCKMSFALNVPKDKKTGFGLGIGLEKKNLGIGLKIFFFILKLLN